MRGNRKYDKTFIAEVLLILKANEFNYSRTSKETAVATNTIKSWLKSEIGAEVLKEDRQITQRRKKSIREQARERKKKETEEFREYIKLRSDELERSNEDFIKRSLDLRTEISKRLLTMIEAERNVKILVEALSTIDEIIRIRTGEELSNKPSNNWDTIIEKMIQKTENHLTINYNAENNDTTPGDRT